MKKTRHTTDQIIEKLRQADVALGKGQKVPEVCKALEITENIASQCPPCHTFFSR